LFEIKYTREELKEQFNIEMWPEDKIKAFRNTLLDWYDEQDHDFPWRKTDNPYHIWISEIMLQQTQVNTVIPYYESFLTSFPTIKSLAEASEDDVLLHWEGLGYYSRARNIKTAAEQIMIHFDGVFPDQPEDIIKLKGIGPYTAGAISSIAFGHPTPAIDGNHMRVLSRLFEIDLDIKKAKNRKVFETVELYLIDPERPGDFNQAMMDLGRTICTPKNYFPERSPVKSFNASYLNDTWQKYPVTSKNNKQREVSYVALIMQNDKGEFLLERRPDTGLLANMWMFPLIDVETIISDGTWKSFKPVILESLTHEQSHFIEDYIEENYSIKTLLNKQTEGVVNHVFSHLIWKISIYKTGAAKTQGAFKLPENCEWVSIDEFEQYAVPTVQKKLWKKFNEITLF
jgi:A/G-specific adenine glycosylase